MVYYLLINKSALGMDIFIALYYIYIHTLGVCSRHGLDMPGDLTQLASRVGSYLNARRYRLYTLAFIQIYYPCT